jgi:hypothetical protein
LFAAAHGLAVLVQFTHLTFLADKALAGVWKWRKTTVVSSNLKI